jgi:hypothetical protein
MKDLEAAKKELRKKSVKFYRLFSSPEGEKVLELLEEMFDHADPRGADVQDTYFKLGQKDVVTYIRLHLKNMRKEEND